MATRNERLSTEPNIWLALVRADGRPHLTPIWFVWVDDHLWMCTQRAAVKARILRARPLVSFALEDGNAPITGEGLGDLVSLASTPEQVRAAFMTKFDWDIGDDDNVVIKVTVTRWLSPSSEVIVE